MLQYGQKYICNGRSKKIAAVSCTVQRNHAGSLIPLINRQYCYSKPVIYLHATSPRKLAVRGR